MSTAPDASADSEQADIDRVTDNARRRLAEVHDYAIQLAATDLGNAWRAAEHSGKTANSLVTSLSVLVPAAAFVVPYLVNKGLHAGGISAAVVAVVVFLLALCHAVWTLRSQVPRKPDKDSSGYLAVTVIDDPVKRCEHYLKRATNMITALSNETHDVGKAAHGKYLRNQSSTVLVILSFATSVVMSALTVLGW